MARAAGGRPNFLFLWSDEQRADAVGCYGPAYGVPGNPRVRTPHVDRLAAEGARFDACYTPYPLCCPARASVWTALYPHEHDVLGNKRPLRLARPVTPPVTALRGAGYYTGYVGKWHVPGASPDALGFADARALGRDWGRDIPEYRAFLRAKGYALDPSPGNVENLSPRSTPCCARPIPPRAAAPRCPSSTTWSRG